MRLWRIRALAAEPTRLSCGTSTSVTAEGRSTPGSRPTSDTVCASTGPGCFTRSLTRTGTRRRAGNRRSRAGGGRGSSHSSKVAGELALSGAKGVLACPEPAEGPRSQAAGGCQSASWRIPGRRSAAGGSKSWLALSPAEGSLPEGRGASTLDTRQIADPELRTCRNDPDERAPCPR